MNNQITISATVNAPVAKVWEAMTQAEHITKWNFAHESWHCPKAKGNVEEGGTFSYRMEAKDGSGGFDFAGTYDEIKKHEKIAYHLDDTRKVLTTFSDAGNATTVTQSFDPDHQAPHEMQQMGWQAILNNMKKYVEENL